MNPRAAGPGETAPGRDTGTGLAGAFFAGLAAYAMLAWATGLGGAQAGWLWGAQAAGWVALAWAWRGLGAGEPGTREKCWIAAGVVGFRVCGIWTVPGWEDDYFRHLWDGWMTWHAGSPYGTAPLEWFASAAVPEHMQPVLDGVNNPERATIYGPVAQAGFALAAAAAPGELWLFKLGLVAVEGAGLWALARWAGWKAVLIAGWCPLAVTEIAFAGHADAGVLAAVAGALLARARGRAGLAAVLCAAACATKGYALLLAPFFLWDGEWKETARRGLVWLGALAVFYAPWIWLTRNAGRGEGLAETLGFDSVAAMAGGFEFNSTGYALLAWLLGPDGGRTAAALLLAGCAAVVFINWIREGGRRGEEPRDEALAKAAPLVVAAWAWWSPVFNPWYALLALPFWARRPTGWGLALLAALPLSYFHGLTLAATLGGTGDFRHPVWVRPLEVLAVVAAAVWCRVAAARKKGQNVREPLME